jgi:hypothetical protein
MRVTKIIGKKHHIINNYIIEANHRVICIWQDKQINGYKNVLTTRDKDVKWIKDFMLITLCEVQLHFTSDKHIKWLRQSKRTSFRDNKVISMHEHFGAF